MSTQNSRGGHLARLAVQPEEQRHGIARVLVEDLLQAFIDKGINYLTVNTQGDNLASLALYRKFKFQETIERYHVYMTQLQ
jgi:ribosomal protein S18 acetylase RimI-like enzyme